MKHCKSSSLFVCDLAHLSLLCFYVLSQSSELETIDIFQSIYLAIDWIKPTCKNYQRKSEISAETNPQRKNRPNLTTLRSTNDHLSKIFHRFELRKVIMSTFGPTFFNKHSLQKSIGTNVIAAKSHVPGIAENFRAFRNLIWKIPSATAKGPVANSDVRNAICAFKIRNLNC